MCLCIINIININLWWPTYKNKIIYRCSLLLWIYSWTCSFLFSVFEWKCAVKVCCKNVPINCNFQHLYASDDSMTSQYYRLALIVPLLRPPSLMYLLSEYLHYYFSSTIPQCQIRIGCLTRRTIPADWLKRILVSLLNLNQRHCYCVLLRAVSDSK